MIVVILLSTKNVTIPSVQIAMYAHSGHTCMYVCMYVRTYVRMYVCMYIYVYLENRKSRNFGSLPTTAVSGCNPSTYKSIVFLNLVFVGLVLTV